MIRQKKDPQGNLLGGLLGNFSVNNVYISGFYYGMYFGANAYIGHHYACEVIRCYECVHMPSAESGAKNFGEGINFFGGTLGNSQGLAIGNQNPNGAFRFFGTSIDYAGAIVNVQAGSVELHGCHIEFNNENSPLTDFPFRCSANQNASLLIQGVKLLRWKAPDQRILFFCRSWQQWNYRRKCQILWCENHDRTLFRRHR